MSYLMDLRELVGSRPLIACGAGVVIINEENKLLLQRRADNDCWGFIGGMMEIGESIEETAKREVFEEVGIKLQDIKFFKVYSGQDFYYKYPNGDEVFNVINLFTYKGNITNEFNIDSKEVKEVKFFGFDEIPDKISPPDILIMEDIINHFKKTLR